MPVSLTCTECHSTLKVRDDLAGKRIKCPRCSTSLSVPEPDEEEFPIVEAVDDEADESPRRTSIRADRDRGRKRDPDEEEEGRDRKRRRRSRDEEDEEDEDDRPIRKSNWQPCPRCEASGAKRVVWTAWGSFYGPAMFNHVRCPECNHCYNGKSGGSNIIPAIIFVTVPLVGIICILGGLFYLLFMRGWVG